VDRGYWESAAQARACPLWRRHADAIHRRLLEEWLPEGPAGIALKTDAYDEAVGEGVVPLLLHRVRTVLSIDISQAFLRLARQRHPRLQVVASDVSSLALAGGSLDCIVSLSTLDHFRHESQIEAALGELHGCLKPGGRLLITMDNLSNPAVWLRNRLPQHWLRRLGIVPLFVGVACTSGRLHRLLTRAGFRVFRIRARLHCPRVLAVAVCRVAAALNFRPLNQAVLWLLAAFEVLDRVPTRFLTGYFIAVLAVKPDGTQEE